MPTVYELADQYVEEAAQLDPIRATMRGIVQYDAEMTDFSPEGVAARAHLDRRTLQTLRGLPRQDERERIAADMMQERLEVAQAREQAGESFRELNIMSTPLQHIRQVFDLMPTDTEDQWGNVLSRMEQVPQALDGATATLRQGMQRGLLAARRQAMAVAKQCRVWGGAVKGTPPFFRKLADRYAAWPKASSSIRKHLDHAVLVASDAYAMAGRFLEHDYAPRAPEKDAVGPERYQLGVRTFLGRDLDLEATYAWGFEELARVEGEMRRVAERILPGQPLAAVIKVLETDAQRAIEGVDRFRQWLQDLMDRTIAELEGRHFDIPEPLQRVEAMIAPPGGAAAMYYTGPSEDFTRPGRTWYPTLGKTRFPLWGEVSTAYHEGVPGHHLQVGMTRYLAKQLSRYQRTMGFVSGYGEGWALYAERLMQELGYLDNPDYELGMLRAHAFRATRVVLDVGMHLELRIPDRSPDFAGETWNPDLGLEFGRKHSYEPPDFMASEIDRYLGWPAQAISYKLGEREMLDIREQLRQRDGSAFDLKAFHSRLLGLGPMGLAQLRREMLVSSAASAR